MATSQVVAVSQFPPRPRSTIWEQKEVMSQCWSTGDPLPLPQPHPRTSYNHQKWFGAGVEVLNRNLLFDSSWDPITHPWLCDIGHSHCILSFASGTPLGAPNWAFNPKRGDQTESPVKPTHSSQKFRAPRVRKRPVNRIKYSTPNIFPQLDIQ